MRSRLLIHDAELNGQRVDVSMGGALIEAIVPTGDSTNDLPRSAEIIDAAGGALLPGLHDHHIHLLALAAADSSLQVGPPTVVDAAGLSSALLREHLRLPPGQWIRAVGYHESVAGPIDRTWLDELGIDRPTRIQHRSGAEWVLNSAGMAAVCGDEASGTIAERGDSGQLTGRLFRADAWLSARTPHHPIDLRMVGRRLSAFGLVGVTDLTPTVDPTSISLIADAIDSGALPFGVTVTGGSELSSNASPELRRGPVKVMIDDHDLPEFDSIVATFRWAHRRGRPVAVHCVTRSSLAFLVAVWHEAGTLSGDRLEHGALITPELFDELAARGIIVVTQPSFVYDRGDQYLVDVEAIDRHDLWRCRSLLDAGILVAFGSDAPFGNPDPWANIRTAVERRTREGVSLGPGETLDARRAIDMYLGSAAAPTSIRRVAVGHRADLCILDRPLEDQLRAPTADAVTTAIVSGAVTYARS
jgi:predicted amidohydrolase YtcJ